MKLSTWAKQNGITYKTAYKMFHAGTLPIRSEQFATGTIIVHPEKPVVQRVALYGRVLLGSQKEELEKQMERLRTFASAKGWQIVSEVADIESNLNERKNLLKLLSDSSITHIVIEHRDRLIRFGSELIAAALESTGRQLVVINETENKNDLEQEFFDVIIYFCSRIYGEQTAKSRAKKALKAAAE